MACSLLLSQVNAQMMSLAVGFSVAFRAAGGKYVPKNHAFIHMTKNMTEHGNPAYYSTYQDESENGDDRQIAQAVHISTFNFSVLQRAVVQELH